MTYAYHLANAYYIRAYLENSTMVEFLPNNERIIRPLTKLASFKAVEDGKKEPCIILA